MSTSSISSADKQSENIKRSVGEVEISRLKVKFQLNSKIVRDYMCNQLVFVWITCPIKFKYKMYMPK